MAIEYPRPGWVQQDAAAMWQSVRECVDEVVESAGSTAHTFGSRAVVEIPNLQPLLKLICNTGFEHHCTMSPAHTADAVAEALGNCLNWEVFRHA